MMKHLDEQIGELKRVFVTEYARRTGTGKALIEARETAARSMGLKRLIVSIGSNQYCAHTWTISRRSIRS